MAHTGHGHSTSPDPHGGPGYETTDASTKGILFFGVFLVAFVAIVILSMLALYQVFVKNREPDRQEYTLKNNVYQDLKALRTHETEVLDDYGWVDRKAGIVRVPIDKAIDMVVKNGVPKGKGPKTEAEVNSRGQKPQTEAEAKKLQNQ
jgi:hypothetical protein